MNNMPYQISKVQCICVQYAILICISIVACTMHILMYQNNFFIVLFNFNETY